MATQMATARINTRHPQSSGCAGTATLMRLATTARSSPFRSGLPGIYYLHPPGHPFRNQFALSRLRR